jgi:hypothetical protein
VVTPPVSRSFPVDCARAAEAENKVARVIAMAVSRIVMRIRPPVETGGTSVGLSWHYDDRENLDGSFTFDRTGGDKVLILGAAIVSLWLSVASGA